ncbi:MAG: type VI secretion system baseplate subunit TssF [Bernardetiaceae bacterium]|jgi:hypothetical protein|nr:type VI secretion system baseplate subunit TssF [Bernardetiaceae bacterium]
MQSLDPKTFTKERIKLRLLKKAADLWGYQENEIDSFDPLVSLLIDACSVEFEKISQEINATQSRLLNRLANIMNPDVLDVPRPAYGILQARATEPQALLGTEAQFVFKRPTGVRASGPELAPEVFFTPVMPTLIHNAAVRFMATGSSLFEVENGNQKRVVAVSDYVKSSGRELWLGLELHPDIKSLDGMSFYFDWQNSPERDRYYQFLPFAQWNLGKTQLGAAIKLAVPAHLERETNLVEDEFDVATKLELQVVSYYQKCFVRVQMGQTFKELGITPQTYPKAFEEMFSFQDLQAVKGEFVWVRVLFPDSLAQEALNNLYCYLNAFPVLNRRLNKLTYRLQQNLNIIPLTSNDAFLNVREVRSASNALYKSSLLTNLQDVGGETYTLRFQGVDRFDSRNARELLYYLLELLRDEGSAFAALGEDFLTSLIKEMNQNIARLEQKLNQTAALQQKNPVPYIVIKPKNAGENVFVEFWTTNGLGGNRVPGGSRLTAYASTQVRNNEIYILTATHGGTDRLNAFEKIYSYKRNLLSRNRLVTQEDIRAACFAQFGNRLRAVEVEKGFRLGATPQAGLIKCVKVKLVPRDHREMTYDEWLRSCEELEVLLASQSANNLPYYVSVSEN